MTSLFTNIPKDLVLNAIKKRWTDIASKTNFNLSQFLYAIEIILDSTSFGFNGQFYEQIFGSPMGSPLSPILADMVMDDLETHCLGLLSFNCSVYYRYVDDIFAVVHRTKIDEILAAFNSYHHRLRFTYEVELNACINFLDTSVLRQNGKLITNWYRKDMSSDRYINFFLNHPMKYKINTIYNLVDRAILLSNNCFHQDNINIVKEILFNNCFPTYIINIYIKKRLNILNDRNNKNFNNVDDDDDDNNDNKRFDLAILFLLSYVEGLSGDVSRILEKTGAHVVYRIPKKLDMVIKRGKDSLPTLRRTNIVYKLDCVDCNASCIGQTKRHLGTRIKEHFNNIKMHNSSNLSVVSRHKVEFGHDFNWTAHIILHNEKHVRKREIAEMFFIKKHANTVNLQKDTDNLNGMYNKIIKVI